MVGLPETKLWKSIDSWLSNEKYALQGNLPGTIVRNVWHCEHNLTVQKINTWKKSLTTSPSKINGAGFHSDMGYILAKRRIASSMMDCHLRCRPNTGPSIERCIGFLGRRLVSTAVQKQTAVTAHFSSKQLLLLDLCRALNTHHGVNGVNEGFLMGWSAVRGRRWGSANKRTSRGGGTGVGVLTTESFSYPGG